jgi:carbamate kinase
MGKLAVIAIGGNSLIKDPKFPSIEDQYQAISETAVHIGELVDSGYQVVITHGNGPQVGFALRRAEIAGQEAGMPPVPLVNCVADTQGALGYQIQQALNNEFQRRGIDKPVVTVVTQVVVDGHDPAFNSPSKPIGSFYSKEEAKKLKQQNPSWHLLEDAGRGYRRVVPSPMPKLIVEEEAVLTLIRGGFSVITVGGGGIPVIQDQSGYLTGVDAVIDKDLASSLLAVRIKADLFMISTAEDQVYLNYGTPQQRGLSKIKAIEAASYMEEGHFGAGSMLPKIKAVLYYLKNGGQEAIITDPANLKNALQGKAGTKIVH